MRRRPIHAHEASAQAHLRHTALTTRTASCSCGQLTVTTTGAPVRVSVCHCLACQRRTGSVFGAQARFRRDAVTFAGASTTYARTGDEGSRVTFHFCAVCGSTVHYAMEGMPEFVAIPVGAFTEPGFPAPTMSVYEDRRHAWVGLPPDIQHRA
jgi:hypothetical protein